MEKAKTKSNLLIVESPAKAKTIKKYLGKNYNVMASMGHLRDLPKSQLGVDIEHNFAPKYITIRGKGDLTSSLKKAAKSSDKVYIATDPDREGEAIAWHLSEILNIDKNDSCRVTFNEITKNAVTSAVKGPRTINYDLVDAQQARRILDRILGYKLSPLLWAKVGSGLSAGRVQSVTTKMVVDREREINAFVSEEYWNISAFLHDNPKDIFEARFYGKNGKKLNLKNKSEADNVLSELKNSAFTVQSVKYSDKKRLPQPPFTTSSLQQEASRKLGFTAKRTMLAAQSLYEGVEIEGKGATGLITYMRTDSLRISEEAKAMALAYLHEKYGDEYVPPKARSFQTKKNAQDAHEAIRPATLLEPDSIKKSLSADEYKLYKLIWARFMASLMESAIYKTMAAEIKAGSYNFKATASKISFKGYMVLYSESTDEAEEKEQSVLPLIKDGAKLSLDNIESTQHFTEAPPRYTEASLIKAMEENGIGRPSTYAPTLSTILARRYIERDKKTLKPTELGIIITDILSEHFSNIVNVEFTANMENDLDKVEEGGEKWVNLIRDFYEPFQIDLEKAELVIGKVEIKDEETDVKCELCGKNMVIKTGRFGKFLACPNYPECKFTKAIVDETGVPCPKCGKMIIGRFSKKGKKYYPCSNKDCDFLLWDKPTGEKCEICGSLMTQKVFRDKEIVRCSNRECEGSKAR
ncbi:MAG: type I DNA topoisomerase [Bacillota bacterium]|nr:type I DNA topoisomerase [Bacillota bacterium]